MLVALSSSTQRPANPPATMVASVTSNARRPPTRAACAASCWLAPPPTRTVEGTLNCVFMSVPAVQCLVGRGFGKSESDDFAASGAAGLPASCGDRDKLAAIDHIGAGG